MRPEARRQLLLGALLALLLARALRALLSTAYYESLVTLRLNGSALWLLALAAPLVALALPPRAARPVALLLAVASVGLGLARFTSWYLEMAAAASGLALVALALALRDEHAPALAGGLALGFAADALLRVAGHSDDLTLGLAAAPFVALAGLVAAWLARPAPRPRDTTAGLAGLGLGCWLALQLAFLASPYHLAREVGASAGALAIAAAAGALLGALGPPRRWLLAAAALALLDVAALRSPFAPASTLLLQAGLAAGAVRLAPRAAEPASLLLLTGSLGALSFLLTYFREPLEPWPLPLLTLAVLAIAASAPRPRTELARRDAAAPMVAMLALALVAAWPSADPPAPREDEVLLLSWNVHQGFGNRGALDLATYEAQVRALQPDVVVLQESDTAHLSSGGVDAVAYLAERLGYHARVGDTGVAVLSRHPFRDEAPADAGAWFLEAPLDVEGRALYVHGVHLARDRAVRATEVTRLLAAGELREHRVVVAGDLNSCPGATCFGRASDGSYDRVAATYPDAWVEAGHAADDPAGNTHPAARPSRRIDHVFVGEGWRAVEAGPVDTALARRGSDHLPVLVRLVPDE